MDNKKRKCTKLRKRTSTNNVQTTTFRLITDTKHQMRNDCLVETWDSAAYPSFYSSIS